NLLQEIVGVARDGRLLHASGDLTALHAIGEAHGVAEDAADHVALPYADQVVDDQAIIDVGDETATQRARSEGRSMLRLSGTPTRLNSSHDQISYAVFCLKKKKNNKK